MRILISLLLVLALLAMGTPVKAAVPVKPDDQDLLALVFPDIDRDDHAHKSVTIRSLTSDYDPAPLTGDMSVNIFHSLRLSNGAHTDRLLVIDVTHRDDTGHDWGGETLLALFRLTPKPRLLDVVDVRGDRETYFWKMLYAPQHDSVIVNATHLNAGEEYVLLNLVEVKGDKFVESKVDFPKIYSSNLGSSSITETPTLQQLKSPNANAAIFTVKVTAQINDPDSGVVKKRQYKTFTARLNLVNGRWQCPRCGSMPAGIAEFENRFGFRSE